VNRLTRGTWDDAGMGWGGGFWQLPPRLLAVGLTCALACWLRLFLEPLGRDQSLFMAQAQALLAGGDLYHAVWEHKPPGILVAYAWAQAVFGQTAFAIHMLDLVAAAAALSLLANLVWCETRSSLSTLSAALLYALYHAAILFGGWWGAAQAEVLADPLLAALLTLVLAPGAVSRVRLGLAGLLVAWLVALKYTMLPLGLLVVPACYDRTFSPAERLRRTSLCALFTFTPWAVWLVRLAATDRIADFTATLEFNLAHAAVSRVSRSARLVEKVLYAWYDMFAIYGGVAVALLAHIARWPDRESNAPARLLPFLGATWLLCLVQVFWQAKFWTYHYRVVLLPLCGLAGLGVDALRAALERGGVRRPTFTLALALGLSLLPHAQSMLEAAHTHHLIPLAFSATAQRATLATYRWGVADFDALETARAAARLERDTKRGDCVFVWGFEPGIYTQAHRKSASRFFYDYPLQPRFSSVHQRLYRQLMADLRAHPPARVLILRRDTNAIETEDSARQLAALPELQAFIDARYEHAWTLGDFDVRKPRAGAPPGGCR
jgi:hypothetical protein